MLYTASSLHHPTQYFHSHSLSFNFTNLRPIKNGAAIIIGRAGSTSTFPRHVKAVDVDYSSMKFLKPADLGRLTDQILTSDD